MVGTNNGSHDKVARKDLDSTNDIVNSMFDKKAPSKY